MNLPKTFEMRPGDFFQSRNRYWNGKEVEFDVTVGASDTLKPVDDRGGRMVTLTVGNECPKIKDINSTEILRLIVMELGALAAFTAMLRRDC